MLFIMAHRCSNTEKSRKWPESSCVLLDPKHETINFFLCNFRVLCGFIQRAFTANHSRVGAASDEVRREKKWGMGLYCEKRKLKTNQSVGCRLKRSDRYWKSREGTGGE